MTSVQGSVEQYLGQWLMREKPLYDELWSDGTVPKCTGLWLAKLVYYFGLSRNFPKDGETEGEAFNADRFESYVGIVKEAAELGDRIEAVSNLAAAFEQFERHDYLMSAASKIMWMHDRDNTLIFDSRARTALDRMRASKETKLPARDYQTFYARWEARY